MVRLAHESADSHELLPFPVYADGSMDTRAVLRIGHSPDPDDAFMWWPLLELNGQAPRVASSRFRIVAVPADIEDLNQRAMRGDDLLEISAFSCATYSRIAARYALTACGSSVGDGYGPKVVAREPRTVASLRGAHIAIPGQGTTAFVVTSLLLGPGAFRATVVPFKEIPARVAAGDFDAGVVIHEGQLTFADEGLVLVEDLGRWWHSQVGLPLPLGANGVLRALDDRHGSGTMAEVAGLLEQSVRYALSHREESIRYALTFAEGMTEALADEFIGMYVNSWTLDYGPTGRLAVRTLLDRAADAGLLPRVEAPEFVGGAQ